MDYFFPVLSVNTHAVIYMIAITHATADELTSGTPQSHSARVTSSDLTVIFWPKHADSNTLFLIHTTNASHCYYTQCYTIKSSIYLFADGFFLHNKCCYPNVGTETQFNTQVCMCVWIRVDYHSGRLVTQGNVTGFY